MTKKKPGSRVSCRVWGLRWDEAPFPRPVYCVQCGALGQFNIDRCLPCEKLKVAKPRFDRETGERVGAGAQLTLASAWDKVESTDHD